MFNHTTNQGHKLGNYENQLSRINFSPLPMQYLGSKKRIVNWIGDTIDNYFPNADQIVDLFAGSGTVSIEMVKREKSVIANDIQPYSYCLLNALFIAQRTNLKGLIESLESIDFENTLFESGRSSFKSILAEEQRMFNLGDSDFKWQEYADFCNRTEVLDSNKDVHELRKLNNWNLFSSYYANTYFGVRQCLELDMLREIAESLEEDLKTQLLGTVISVMTYYVSSTTHLAQFLKISSENTAKNIVRKRKCLITEEVIKRLKILIKFETYHRNKVFNVNFLDVIQPNHLSSNPLIYADPPYFKEHYSRYYHVLDTFFLYDFPELTYNPRMNGITVGRYRKNRIVSDFGLKSKVKVAFENLFQKAYKFNLPVVLSYANTSLVQREGLKEIATKSGYKVNVLEKELMHSGQGQKRNKKVIENLFVCSV